MNSYYFIYNNIMKSQQSQNNLITFTNILFFRWKGWLEKAIDTIKNDVIT